MKTLGTILLFVTLSLSNTGNAQESTPGQYQDLVTSGWLSDVNFELFTVWPGEYQEQGKIELTFVARFSSAFGTAVKLDVQRVYVGADGTQHFVLRPLPILSNEIVAGGRERTYDSRIKVTVPVGLNGPTVYLHAITADSISTKSVQLPAPN